MKYLHIGVIIALDGLKNTNGSSILYQTGSDKPHRKEYRI